MTTPPPVTATHIALFLTCILENFRTWVYKFAIRGLYLVQISGLWGAHGHYLTHIALPATTLLIAQVTATELIQFNSIQFILRSSDPGGVFRPRGYRTCQLGYINIYIKEATN